MKIEILTKHENDRLYPFWYYGDGDIFILTHKNRKIIIFPEGNIRVKFKDCDYYLKNMQAVDYALKNNLTDIDLEKAYFDENNWFDFIYIDTISNNEIDFLEDSCYNYFEALECAKECILDEDFWNNLQIYNNE